ncbi:tyrosinase cofactor [Streptomyces bacillaris]|uniref:apotyrosinase chaperone MelC1 n=1 Tax=Streptomyces bacillaris TaxID=68179 RepID=UPI003363E3C1
MSRITRRHALGAAAATALTGLVLAGLARTAGATSAPRATGHQPPEGHAGHDGPQPFSETFQGRRIEGAPSHADGHHGGYAVRIDGEELHVMRNADSTWVSVINHYETFTTPRAVARAAVIELQGARLVPLA